MSSKVKLILDIRGVKQVDIARALKISPSIVSEVINLKKPPRRIENHISRRVGMKRAELFSKEAA